MFRYHPEYSGYPISSFPNLDQEYRSKHIWPFFAVRIPPLNRPDVREVLDRRAIKDDQIFEILGAVGRLSVANPYEFRLGQLTNS